MSQAYGQCASLHIPALGAAGQGPDVWQSVGTTLRALAGISPLLGQ